LSTSSESKHSEKKLEGYLDPEYGNSKILRYAANQLTQLNVLADLTVHQRLGENTNRLN